MSIQVQSGMASKFPVMISILKNFLFFQNVASFVLSKIPATVEHNIQKYQALRKAFYLTALEQLHGDYLEFGVFTGSSFVYALRVSRKFRFLGKVGTRFFGFDSFAGFGKVGEDDSHPFYLDSNFAVNEGKIIRNIKRHAKDQKVELIKGYFENTLEGHSPSEFGIKLARVILIDCDLKVASKLALNYVKPILQAGTVIVLDDFFSYKGNSSLGTAGAFHEFIKANPHICFRRMFDYGYGGVVYIVSSIEEPPKGEG